MSMNMVTGAATTASTVELVADPGHDADHRSAALTVTFYGVRGSTPCSGPDRSIVGGNTSCVGVELAGQPDAPVVFFDFGTGARDLARRFLDPATPFDGICLLTHAHWDHIQGIPFFPPLLRGPDDRVTIYAPRCETGSDMASVLNSVMCPPIFPVGVDALPGRIEWVEVDEGTFVVGDATVLARVVPHTGRTMGYRLEHGGVSVTYIPDHQQPHADPDHFVVDDGVAALAADTDLLIFDSQYTREEFHRKCDWGHGTYQYAAWVAGQVGARALAMFHHDPAHDDQTVERLVERARAEVDGVDIFAAVQQRCIDLSPSAMPICRQLDATT